MRLLHRLAPLALAGLVAATAAASAETITYENETEPYPGLRIYERRTSGPNWRIRVAFVSLCNNGIHMEARSPQATRITAPTWGSAMGVQLAVNGDFYRTDRSTPTVYGDAVGVGVRWPTSQSGRGDEFSGDWYHQRYGWIAFGPGWVEFTHSEYVKNHADELGVSEGWYPQTITSDIPDGTYALVSGFPELVVEGQALTSFPDRGDTADRHPRTAMGLTEDRSTFLLAVVDGRSSASVGMTGAELAALMKEMGAHTAFNLDGGGSTQMWLDKGGVLNTPSDGSPRSVANHWGVFAGSGHGKGAAPGHCFVAGGCFPTPLAAAEGSRFGDLPESGEGFAALATSVDAGYLGMCQQAPREMACPSCPMSRRDAIAYVARAGGLDLSSPPASPTFSDVAADDEGYAEIEAAAAAGWIVGCGDGKLCPEDAVTRAQLAGLLVDARGWDAPALGDASFRDVAPGDAAYDAAETLAAHCEAEVGCGGGAFCPRAALTRADAASLAVLAFDLDGSGRCAAAGDDRDGDGEPDAPGPPDAGGGCSTGGGGAAGPLAGLVLLAALPRSRRRRWAES